MIMVAVCIKERKEKNTPMVGGVRTAVGQVIEVSEDTANFLISVHAAEYKKGSKPLKPSAVDNKQEKE